MTEASMAADAGARPLRVALVGAGGLGRGWSQVILGEAGAELGAIVDPLVGTGRQSAWLADLAHVPQLASMAAARDRGLEAVVVTAFSTVHAEVIREALESGLHVLVEKPFTTTLAEAEALVTLAASRGRTLMVSQNYRYFPGVETIREIVRDRRHGAVRAVAGQFWCDWPGKPYQHGMSHVMGLEMAVHHFDLVRAMFDAEAVGGHVREWNPAYGRYAGGAALECVFDMDGAGGTFPFLYSGSLVGRAPRTPWPGVWRFEFDDETLVLDTVDGRYGLWRAHAEGHEWLGRFDGDDMMFDRPLAHFLAAIREGREPWSSGRDNLGTMRMALGAEVFGR